MHDVRELVSHPHVVEVLDALSDGPTTLACLRANVPTARRGLTAALRVLAVHGMVTTRRRGSWDNVARSKDVYFLTGRGRGLFEALSTLSAWTAMLENNATKAPDR